MTIRSRFVIACLAAGALLGAHSEADAKKKKKKKKDDAKAAATGGAAACGIDFLPLVEGTGWTYKFFIPSESAKPAGVMADDPETLIIRVAKVATDGDTTRVTLEESYRKVSVTTELTCTEDTLLVPPDSFFFSGEPGGGVMIELGKLDRKGESFLTKKGLTENTFQEFKTTATRKVTDGSGAVVPPARLEIERKMTVRGREETESAMGPHKAIRVDIQLTGRAALDAQKDKPFNMPAVDSSMWFAPGVGLVRVESKIGTGWQLSERKAAE